MLLFKFLSIKTILSLLLYVGIESTWLGFYNALGIVLLITIHEFGHAIKAYEFGEPLSAPIFIPFFGGIVAINKGNFNGWQDAMVYLAGPMVGGVGCFAFWCLGVVFKQDWLIYCGCIGFYMNLFNLLPIGILDGRGISDWIHPYFWLISLPAVLGLLYLCSPTSVVSGRGLYILAVVFFAGLSRKFDTEKYSEMTVNQCLGVLGLYILTGVGLTGGFLLTLPSLSHGHY